MNKKYRLLIGALTNLIIFGLEVFCLITFIGYLTQGNKDNRFIYFTNISNLYVGFVAIFNALFLFLSFVKGKMMYPKLLSLVKYFGLTMTTLTFMAVLLILAPVTSYPYMYSGVKIFTHLITPLLAIISYLFFEEKNEFKWKESWLGVIPPSIYCLVYIINVVICKSWPDIYKANTKGLWYLYALGVFALSIAITQGIYFLKKYIDKKLTNLYLS